MTDQEELNARIESAKNNLRFCVLYWDGLVEEGSEEELEKLINKCLDILIELLKLKD